jgi:hypothetical protein
VDSKPPEVGATEEEPLVDGKPPAVEFGVELGHPGSDSIR